MISLLLFFQFQHDKFELAIEKWDVPGVNSLLAKGLADVEHIIEVMHNYYYYSYIRNVLLVNSL